MEDAVLMIPVGGWDIARLINDGELGIVKRLLKLPNEYRFTRAGIAAFEKREEELWNKKMIKK